MKDFDLGQRQLVVRDAKGMKDRVAYGGVELPCALERKYPRAHLDFGWQYVFPADRPSRDPRTGALRRHHLYADSVQRRVREAIRAAAIEKPGLLSYLASFVSKAPSRDLG